MLDAKYNRALCSYFYRVFKNCQEIGLFSGLDNYDGLFGERVRCITEAYYKFLTKFKLVTKIHW